MKINQKQHVTKQGIVKRNPVKNYDSFYAGEILRQLGGNKFIAMTGAKDFARNDDKKQITFKIGRNSSGINCIRIILNSMDTYDMEFIRLRAGKITVVNEVKGIYNDQLQEIFTEYTGMCTHL